MRVCHFIIPKQGDYTGLPPNEQAFESHSEVVKRGLAGSHGTKYIFYLCLFSFVYCIIFVFCICLTVEGLRARFGGVWGASKRYNRQAAVSYNGQQGCLTMGRAYAITPLQVIQVIRTHTHTHTLIHRHTKHTYTHQGPARVGF